MGPDPALPLEDERPLPRVAGAASGSAAMTILLDAAPALRSVDGAVLADAAVGGIHRYLLITRTAANACEAVSAICTHEGCTVSLRARPLFVCPCHGSMYTASGLVVRGPAPAALPCYTTTLSDDRIVVDLVPR